MSRLSLLFVIAASMSLAACSAPKREVTVDQIKNLPKLRDVMDAQATYADPLFKKRTQAAFTDAELASIADASERLQATALKAKDFSKGPQFDVLAVALHDHAAELGAAAQAKDAAAVRTALVSMKATCKECHSKFR